MSEPRTTRRHELLRRVHHHRLTAISVLPSLITLINALCGFAAIVFAGSSTHTFTFNNTELSNFYIAAFLIFVAMIADTLDGRIARMSHNTTSFGGQLDSLCDIVSFGLAPAYLVLRVLQQNIPQLISPPQAFAGFIERFLWVAVAVYLACAAIRLARFNVENEEDETSHMSFVGLPTPAAAGVVASIVLFYEDILIHSQDYAAWLFTVTQWTIISILPFATIGAGILMVSRIVYPHMFNQYFKGRKPLTHLLWAIFAICLIVWLLEKTLVVCFCGFALSGLIKRALHKGPTEEPAEDDQDQPEDIDQPNESDQTDDEATQPAPQDN